MNAKERIVALTPRMRTRLIAAFAAVSKQNKTMPVHISETGERSVVGFVMRNTPDSSFNTTSVRNIPLMMLARFIEFLPTFEERIALNDAQAINDALLHETDFFTRKLYNRIKNAYGYEFAEECRLEMNMSQSQIAVMS